PLDERVRRHTALLAEIRKHDVHWWTASFLDALDETGAARERRQPRLVQSAA
ncbi:alpha,alpha-trehalose-phosphate synthase, partial [Burkholderia gladioli]